MTTPLVLSWLIVTSVLGVMATIVVWSRMKSKLRGLAVIYFVVVVPVASLAVWPVLGKPVPVVKGITLPSGRWTVLGHKVDKPRGVIYLMLDMGDDEPTLIVVPYSKDTEERMQQIANAYGTGVFSPGDDSVKPLSEPRALAPKPPEKKPLVE